MVAPKEASTCRSKGPKGEWIERTFDYLVACQGSRGKISQMKVVEDFESRPHKAVSFVVEREKEMQEWNEQKLPKVLSCYSGGRLPGRSTREKGREGEKEEDRRGWRVWHEVAQEVVAGIKKKTRTHEDAKPIVHRTVGQRIKQNWDCSQIKNEEEEEDEDRQWDEDEKLDDSGTKKSGGRFFAGRRHAKGT